MDTQWAFRMEADQHYRLNCAMCRIIRNDARISFQIVSHVHHSFESRNHTSTHMSEGFINDEVVARHIICANIGMLEVVMSDQDIIHSGTLVLQVSDFESCEFGHQYSPTTLGQQTFYTPICILFRQIP